MAPNHLDSRTNGSPRRLARIAGIDIYVHWTFAVMLGWVFLSHVWAKHGLGMAIEGVSFVATIFACVALHELGHALTAQRFGVRTRDITLYPIGGVARLERIPEKPSQELLVAIAGPMVNFAIAGALWFSVDALPDASQLSIVGGRFLAKVMYVNLSIGLFNLLPAFPMDGGRVLRALLALRMDYVRATQIAATAGQIVAALLGLAGLFGNWFLIFIALFVFSAAQQEALIVQTRAVLRGVPVTDAMLTSFQSLQASEPISRAVELLLASEQEDFPILRDGTVVGVLTRKDLLRALAGNERDQPVGTVMTQTSAVAEATEMLDGAFQRMQESGCTSLPVVRQGSLVGMLTLEHLGKWLMVRGALQHRDPRPNSGAGLSVTGPSTQSFAG
jgi:Zn-dependent protease/predicted transcriptional regulator